MAVCSVIGQSNSIIRNGYFETAVANRYFEVGASARLGASPSVLGPYSVTGSFFNGSDFCIIDLCVVDSSALGEGSITEDQIGEWVSWIGHTARRYGCQPIFVLIPMLHQLTDKGGVLDLYKSIAQKNGFYFIDVRTIISSIGVDGSDLYTDVAHPNIKLSDVIADRLKRFIDNFSYNSLSHEEICFTFRIFERLSVKDFSLVGSHVVNQEVHYETSLLKFDGLRLSAGSQVFIESRNMVRVHAVMVNAASSFKKICLQGDKRLVKNLNLRAFSHNVPFEARLVPLMAPLKSSSGTLMLELAQDDELVNEPTMHGCVLSREMPQHVEIGDLLIESATEMVAYTASVPHVSDLDIINACNR